MRLDLEKIYRFLRIFVFLIPAAVLVYVTYLILFPVERFSYFRNAPELSKFEFSEADGENIVSFGVFPTQSHQFIDLSLELQLKDGSSCTAEDAEIDLEKTQRAFLFSEEKPVENEDQLRSFLFRDNSTKYPSGTLLHLVPTNEVYLVSAGKKILFPGPEIFRAFGYSFENLVAADKSTVDLFPSVSRRFFSWTDPHPDGTIFQAFPSHKLYIVSGERKHEIKNPEIISRIWPQYYFIAVGDSSPASRQTCPVPASQIGAGCICCRLDRKNFQSALGGYYNFTLSLPTGCTPADLAVETGQIKLISEKSFATVKDSLRKIFASVLNRYIYDQPQ